MTGGAQVIAWLELCAAQLAQAKDQLTELDAAIGDADHGVNMDRGFRAVAAALPGLAGQTPGEVLKATAMTLIKTVGGASGPLYGTFFLRAATACGPAPELDVAVLVEVLAAGVRGVKDRGKAQAGDKTMLDALEPALAAMAAARDQQAETGAMLAAGARAAREGAEATIPLVARKGRASYLGPRSAGHQDPGATSAALILEAAARTLAA